MIHHRRGHILIALLIPVAAAASTHALGDPPPPAGGFRARKAFDQLVLYGDGASTLADVRYPDDAFVPLPAGGLPVIVAVHGLGSNRSAMGGTLDRFARNGYFGVAYDVRGQGDA